MSRTLIADLTKEIFKAADKALGQDPKFRSFGIVSLAIAPNQFDIVSTFGGRFVFVSFQFALDRA